MKHIKLFEAWSAKFNRTLQGASAIAKEMGISRISVYRALQQ